MKEKADCPVLKCAVPPLRLWPFPLTLQPLMENILEQLNDSQRSAVEYCDGAQLVIAGAGAGKTRVLTFKIAYLLQQGYQPWNILALTFTNKAAREMKERIGGMVGNDTARRLSMGTFHSVFARILRSEARSIGYESNFTIYDQSDSRQLIKNIIKEMQLDDKAYKPSGVADRISLAKNRLLLPQAYAANATAMSADAMHKTPALKDIYRRYAERCRLANAMDFDDLLLNTYLLFQRNDDIRRKYVELFHYVLVDEYQDTNFAQQQILLQLTKDRQRVCAVGDDAQSIYSFRGANIDNILKFNECYKDAKLFKLERNYRSTQLIVEAANSLIRHNPHQIPKQIYSENEHGDKLTLKPAYSDREESLIVCNDIKAIMRSDRCGYGDFAILYRTNSQSRCFEESLRKADIPYKIYGGLSFYQRKEIKDVIAYFRLVANPDDEEALRRVLNYPKRGLGDTTLGKIAGAALREGVSLWSIVSAPRQFGLAVSGATMGKLQQFSLMVDGWRGRIASEDALILGRNIILESGVGRDISSGSNDPEDLARQENLDEFLAGMQDFVESRREEGNGCVSLTDFLQEVSLMTDLDSDGSDDGQKVVLMTIHSAKGLEFPTVFVVGMEDNIFPSPMCGDNPRALEEERRLLYVAVTRAEKRCILTCAQNRFRYGRLECGSPSRFLRDFDPKLLHVVQAKGASGGYKAADYDSKPRWQQQNPHPVATQFRADPMPRIVPKRTEEPRTSPFSEAFEHKILSAGGRLRPVSSVQMRQSPAAAGASGGAKGGSGYGVSVGNRVEHPRFGLGEVVGIDGEGESSKAIIRFDNIGVKQLLLKFAPLKVL